MGYTSLKVSIPFTNMKQNHRILVEKYGPVIRMVSNQIKPKIHLSKCQYHIRALFRMRET